jgi:hypothetical protein
MIFPRNTWHVVSLDLLWAVTKYFLKSGEDVFPIYRRIVYHYIKEENKVVYNTRVTRLCALASCGLLTTQTT